MTLTFDPQRALFTHHLCMKALGYNVLSDIWMDMQSGYHATSA